MAFDYASKIRALLANADDERLPDDVRANFRAKALHLMDLYRIAEEEALAVDPTAAEPIVVTIDLKLHGWEMAGYYPMILQAIARHTGVRVNADYLGVGGYHMTIVGYEGDVRYTEFLWTSAHLMFATRVDPDWDYSLTPEENIYRMRAAGIKRKVIADRAGWDGDNAAARSKVQRIYVAQAKDRSEDPLAKGLGFNSRNYRESYAEAFVSTLRQRLQEARDAADSVNGALVLHGRQERVDEAFYALFPAARPSTTVKTYTDPTKDCKACQRAKTTCNEHKAWRTRGWSARDELAWQRRINGASAVAGRLSGRTAAEGVVIQRGHTKAQRVDRSGHAIEG